MITFLHHLFVTAPNNMREWSWHHPILAVLISLVAIALLVGLNNLLSKGR